MKIISVRYITDNKTYDYPDEDDRYKNSSIVLIEHEGINEVAKVLDVYNLENIQDTKNPLGSGNILRNVSLEDRKKIKQIKSVASGYIQKCQTKVRNYELDIKIIDADLSFDEKKLTIYFTSEKRIDFRSLVSDLVKSFQKIIRLQQVGLREEIKQIGGIGKCGREVCCAKFLGCLNCATTDCAKKQNLNETKLDKISGICGKLMCCLKYEEDMYVKIRKNMPKIGEMIKTKKGLGEVIKQNILKNTVTLKMKNNDKIDVEIKNKEFEVKQ
jgi:cell fate regulator YaaT (PSP1 superfamily)